MIFVTDQAREAWKRDSSHKELKISFPNLNLTYTNEKIIADSLTLNESIMSSDNLEFFGCISSNIQFQIVDAPSLKGQKVQVSINADDTQEIRLFTGYVDSCKKENNRRISTVVAYDILYYVGDVDVANWYKGLTFPMPLSEFRKGLVRQLGIQENLLVPFNDNMNIVLYKEYEPNELNGLGVLKSICQVMGVCGIIDREGFLTYRYIENTIVHERFDKYKSMKYEDFVVNPISMVTLRMNEDDAGTSVGAGNRYIVQGNMFVFGKHNMPVPRPANFPEYDDIGNLINYVEDKTTIATNIRDNVKDNTFRPYDAEVKAAPYLEVGDRITIENIPVYSGGAYSTTTITVPIIKRTLKGIQSMFDTFQAEGVENQRTFISDLGINIDLVKSDEDGITREEVEQIAEDVSTDIVTDYAYSKSTTEKKAEEISTDVVTDYTYDKKTIDEKISGGGEGLVKVESVKVLPAKPEENTLYLLQGEVVVS